MTGDPVANKTGSLMVWRVGVAKGRAKEEVEAVLRDARTRNSDVLVVRTDLIFGSDHIRSALYHARKATEERRNVSESLAMETLLYASGERQLGSAIRKMAVPDDAEDFVVARLSGSMVPIRTDWSELPETIEFDEQALMRFGVVESEIRTIKGDRARELVLEKVAAVDTIKK